MKAMLVPVGGFPREIEVDGLRDLQRAVNGCIEPGWMEAMLIKFQSRAINA